MNFPAYTIIAPSRYRERFGLDFEQFAVAQHFKHRPGRSVSQQDNSEEALDTINNAQLHFDENYASKTEWKRPLGVSTMTLQRVIGMTSKTFGKSRRIVSFEDISMTHPVFGGDTLYAESVITGTSDAADPNVGLVSVTTTGVNQAGASITRIVYTIEIYRRAKHPESGHQGSPAEDEKFNGYRKLDDGSLIEQVGLYFEELEPGEIYEHRPGKTFTAEENRLHALRSLDLSPRYSDQFYCERFEQGRAPIFESLVVGTVTALTTRTFDRVVANLEWKNIKLPAAVLVGDTIYAESTIVEKRESKSRPNQGIVTVTSRAVNQHGDLVCSYERHLLVYKKGLGPYEEAGY